MKEITCERCGGIAIRSPLCGSCAYALAVPTWERIKARMDSTVSDAALDRWMNTHSANPANKVTADEAKHWLLNSCPTCLYDPCQCLPDPKREQERHENQYAFEAFQQWRQEDR